MGRLQNIISDRRLLEHYALRLDILYFLGYDVDEELPEHSTVSRTRQLYPAAVFEHLFDYIFRQCVACGLVSGERQALDSVPVKANTSLNRLCEKQPLETLIPLLMVVAQPPPAPVPPYSAAVLSASAHQLRHEAARQAKCQREPRERQEAGLLRCKSPLVTFPDPAIRLCLGPLLRPFCP